MKQTKRQQLHGKRGKVDHFNSLKKQKFKKIIIKLKMCLKTCKNKLNSEFEKTNLLN